MNLGPRWIWLLIAGGILAALILGGIVGSCERQRDTPGQRADSVLADTSYRDTIRQQDARIVKLEDSLRASDRDRARWKRTALARLARDDADQAAVDSTVALGVPDSVAPAVFWKDQWEAQRRITARLRSETVPALLATIAADSLGIAQRDEYGAEMRSQRDFARARANEITAEFQRYRNDSRPGIDLGLFRVPDEVVKVAAAGVIFYAGCKVGGGC